MLNIKLGSCKYQLLNSFGRTHPGNRTLVYRLRCCRFNYKVMHSYAVIFIDAFLKALEIDFGTLALSNSLFT